MKIILEKDNKIHCDLNKVIKVLNSICTNISFEAVMDKINDEFSDTFINFEDERERITNKLKTIKRQNQNCLFMSLNDHMTIIIIFIKKQE